MESANPPVENHTMWIPNMENDHLFLEHVNLTEDQERWRILKIYKNNTVFSDSVLFLLLSIYTFIILFAVVGNILTLKAVVRAPSMRTPRNFLIANLAISDILLCLVSQPITLLYIVTIYWPLNLGRSRFLCRIFSSVQIIPIFVSTFSVTGIVTMDKFQIQRKRTTLWIIFGIWVLACILSTPAYAWTNLHNFEESISEINLEHIDYCIDDWVTEHGPVYSILFIAVFHYGFPLLITSFAYSLCTRVPRCMPRITGGFKKESYLLICLGTIFWVCWIPSHAIHIILVCFGPVSDDNYENYQFTTRIIYAACELFGMMSPCFNPFLLALLDEGFRKEFAEMGVKIKGCGGSCVSKRSTQASGRLEEAEEQNVQFWNKDGEGDGSGGGQGEFDFSDKNALI